LTVVVDLHAHVVVPGLGASVSWDDDGQLVIFKGNEIRAAKREFSNLERILDEQVRSGVDVVVLSPWVNLCGIETGRQNEVLAGYVSERVWALGTVNPLDPGELVELMADGRLLGVEIPAAPGGDFLGDAAFADFWAAAEETGALVFVHPRTMGLQLPVLSEAYMWNTLGNPFETTITAAHMIANGVVDRHPRLRVLLAHGGGVIAALRGRLAHEQRVHPPGRDVVPLIRTFLVDTVVHDASLLRELVDFFGADNVVLGSDYPFDMGADRPADVVRAAGLPESDERKILGGNAFALRSGS
jgi:aminocarboxymuconate-semialdehyde decarboxylase